MTNTYLKIFAFWIMFLSLESCLLPKKLDKFFDKKPALAAQKCAEKFPIKETIDTVIVKDNELIDQYEREFVYLYSFLDSLVGQSVSDSTKREIVTVFKEKQIPVYKYIVKTKESTAKCKVLLDSMQTIENDKDAYIESLLDEKEFFGKKHMELYDKYDKVKKQRNDLYWWLIVALIIIFRNPIIAALKRLIKI